MSVNPSFHPIDLQAWPMAQSFHYYTQIAPTTYTINVSMDVTILRKALKDRGLKFFPTYLYLVTKAICGRQELRIAVQDGIVGYWDSLTPAYPQFHEDDKTTSLLWTEYCGNFEAFYNRYIEDVSQHDDSHGILSSKGLPPSNAFIISCIPWFTFNSNYYFPSIEAGGFVESGGKITMPLSVTVHHATTDGYHLKLFFEDLQRTLVDTEEWLFA